MWDSLSQTCRLVTFHGIELRDGTPQNFWFAFGFGGSTYVNHANTIKENIEAAQMQGHFLAQQVNLYHYFTNNLLISNRLK